MVMSIKPKNIDMSGGCVDAIDMAFIHSAPLTTLLIYIANIVNIYESQYLSDVSLTLPDRESP